MLKNSMRKFFLCLLLTVFPICPALGPAVHLVSTLCLSRRAVLTKLKQTSGGEVLEITQTGAYVKLSYCGTIEALNERNALLVSTEGVSSNWSAVTGRYSQWGAYARLR